MFGYGFLAVVLVLYLGAIGFDGAEVGLLLGLTLLGDAAISLLLTTRADRFGRRRTLFLGSLLMVGAGIVFAGSTAFPVLLVAATLGVLSPSGNEVGPFLAIEQASLSQLVDARGRTSLFARYQVVGSVATACGSLAAGVVTQAALDAGFAPADSFRVVIIGYAIVGVAMAFVFPLLSRAVEVPAAADGPGRRPPDDPPGAAQVAGDRGPAVGAVRARRVRRRVRHPGVHRLLADRAVRGRSRPGRRDPVRGQHPGRDLGAGRRAARGPVRPDPDDGVHAPAVERAADPGAVHADARAGGRPPADPVQHQPDGRAHAAVVHDRRRRPRRAVGGRGGHRDRPQPGRRRLAADRRAALPGHGLRRAPFVIGGSIKIVYDLLLYRAFSNVPPPEERQPGSA